MRAPEEPLREIRLDASVHGCPLSVFTEEEGQLAVCRVADPRSADEGLKYTLNLVGDRAATKRFLHQLEAKEGYRDLEVVNLTPYAMVLKVREVPPTAGTATVMTGLVDLFGEDIVLDPFPIDDGTARVRVIVTEPTSTRGALQKLQTLQQGSDWKTFQVRGVDAFDPREHVGLARRLLTVDQESLLRLAVDMGYYDTPKKCTLEDIADEVGLSPSPVHKRLKRSEERLVEAFLDPGSVSYPAEGGGAPRWVQEIARGDGPMVEVLARVRWPDSPSVRFTLDHSDTQVVLHPFFDDPRSDHVVFLAIASTPAPAKEYVAALDAFPYSRDLELVSEGEDHVVVRAEIEGPDHDPQDPPLVGVARRFGREAYLNPVFVEDGDLWLSVVIARHVTFEDVEAELESAGEELGWEGLDLVSIRPLDAKRGGPGGRSRNLTGRQREVLDVASALGYYRTPRESTLADIARTLGVSENAVHKNLTAAERKIVRTYLDAGV